MVNVMIVEDQKLVRSILESYIKKEEGYELLSSIPGADSLWYKDTDEELLMEAVRRTMAGEHIFPDAPPVVEVGTARSTEFTNAEMKVLRCLVRGMSYGAIAGALGIEVTTVKYHVSNMLQKTNLENKLQLAITASEAKLVVELNEK